MWMCMYGEKAKRGGLSLGSLVFGRSGPFALTFSKLNVRCKCALVRIRI